MVRFGARAGYEAFSRPFAADEPLARFEPLHLPDYDFAYEECHAATLAAEDWGAAVFDRLTGHLAGATFDHGRGRPVKRYAEEDGIGPATRAVRAVGDAMTDLARTPTGYGDPPEPRGGTAGAGG